MALEKGVIGYALYLEFRDPKGNTMQLVCTPPFMDSPSGIYVPPVVFGRNISRDKPRSKWRKSPIKDTENLQDAGGILKADSVESATALNQELITKIVRNIENVKKLDFGMVGDPLIVEIAAREGTAIRDRDTPDGLFRRVMSARKDSDYPEELYSGETI